MALIQLAKRVALNVTAQPIIGRLIGAVGAPRCAVLMLHRFASMQGTTRGHDGVALRTTLAALAKSGVAFEYIDDVVARLRAGEAVSRKGRLSVAITVDDGYADLLEVESIFAEYDCPVTGFVVPDVIDGNVWFWWDQIDWVFRHAGVNRVTLEIAGAPLQLTWADAAARLAVQSQLGEQLKLVPNALRLSCLKQLSVLLDVPIPAQPPAEFRVLTWSELRSAEQRGMRFGPHTMTHPILSQCSDAEAEREIAGSIGRVGSELARASSVFCYPNGRAIDYGLRETALIEALGMAGAVSTEPSLVAATLDDVLSADWPYRLPRFAYDDRRGGVQRMFLPSLKSS
ncbi:MAG: polysaccharide deacetylase family protein [Gemmatimonadota bacterium]|nr:polysaccharide deacetylase family protein [Gemmatimonadota bacterium]